jgi:hypothetical protein
MSTATPALLAAAAGVGLGHAIMPDHWLPLAVVGRTRRYPMGRVARLSGLAGAAHVLVSLLLGAIIIAIGLQLRSPLEHAQNTIVGCILIATGLAFVALELAGRGHRHSHHHGECHLDHHGECHLGDHHHRQPDVRAYYEPRAGEREADHEHSSNHATRPHSGQAGARVRALAEIVVPFGAAASPDLTILPVFLAAAAAGAGAAVGSLVAFGTVTIVTIVTLTLLATFGGYHVRASWLERWGNAITAATLVIIGTLIAAGAI